MKNRAALLSVTALCITAAATGTQRQDSIHEVPAPVVVDVAPSFIIGPDHVTDPDLQAARDDYSAELRTRAAAEPDLPPGLQAAYAAAVGGITVSYDPDHPAPNSVRAVVDDAVARWDSVIATVGTGPIVVRVTWRSLGNPSLLGYAGPEALYQGGGLPTNALYPAALVNTLAGIDANGSQRPEVLVTLNSDLLANNRWYLGLAGTPPTGQIDLYSVVLHEVGHGFGFLGSAELHNGGSTPSLWSTPYIYDTLTRAGSTPVISVGDQGTALRSGDVFIDVSDSIDFELYAPSTWLSGSSFSHFDEYQYPGGTAGSLMTPMLSSAETARILDAPTLGVMARIGWPLTVPAVTPTIASTSPSLTAAVVSWNQNFWKTGTAPDRYVVEAWRNGSKASSVTVAGSATGAVIGSLSPGATYTIKVVPWGPNGNGTPASTTVVLPIGGGPADPADWPSFIRPTALDGQINRLYQAYFLRLPDHGGFDYWLGRRAGGLPLADVSAAFAASAEFQNRYGNLSDGTFVDLVYANVLNRVADASGRAFWLGQLQQGVSRGQVMVGFAESAEYVERTKTTAAGDPAQAKVLRLYRASFLRDPDAAGLRYWTGQVQAGVPLATIASAFAGSNEFRNRYGALTNAQFVARVYANVLGRAPDAGGAAYWTGLLDGGVGRGTVLAGFSESREFIRSTGTLP